MGLKRIVLRKGKPVDSTSFQALISNMHLPITPAPTEIKGGSAPKGSVAYNLYIKKALNIADDDLIKNSGAKKDYFLVTDEDGVAVIEGVVPRYILNGLKNYGAKTKRVESNQPFFLT